MVQPTRPWPKPPSPRELGLPIPGDKVTYAWEPWFAWHPVKTIRGKWKWMRSINQRFIGTLGFPRAGYYQYGDVFDILRE